MSTAQLVDQEFPARTSLKNAQARLAAVLATAKAASDALARGREHLGVLERLRDEAKAEIVDEARSMAETFEQEGVCAMIGGSAQRGREIKDELASFEIAFDILVQKNASAQRAIGECEAALATAVKAVVAEEVSPLLCRMEDCERAASHLKSQLRALQYCGRWGLCPETLPRQLLREPVNVFHANQPLNWGQQKLYYKHKSAWVTFADQLREDANALLSLGD